MAKVQTFSDPTVNLRAVLLDALATTFDGQWIDVSGYDKLSIHLEILNATVQVFRSNKPSPLTSADGIQVGADISTSAFVEIKTASRCIMLKVTANTGAVSAWLEAV